MNLVFSWLGSLLRSHWGAGLNFIVEEIESSGGMFQFFSSQAFVNEGNLPVEEEIQNSCTPKRHRSSHSVVLRIPQCVSRSVIGSTSADNYFLISLFISLYPPSEAESCLHNCVFSRQVRFDNWCIKDTTQLGILFIIYTLLNMSPLPSVTHKQ